MKNKALLSFVIILGTILLLSSLVLGQSRRVTEYNTTSPNGYVLNRIQTTHVNADYDSNHQHRNQHIQYKFTLYNPQGEIVDTAVKNAKSVTNYYVEGYSTFIQSGNYVQIRFKIDEENEKIIITEIRFKKLKNEELFCKGDFC